MENEKKVSQKSIVGIVVSDKMEKTVVVLVSMKKKHPIYGKYITSAPARSCVAVKSLPKGALVEVEVIAMTE